MSHDASRARARRNGNLATIVRRLGLYNKLFKGAAGDQEEEISRLEIQVEKLKDLCMKQREEIKSLQSTILFPDSLQLISRQLASLEGRLQSLAHDVGEVKAENYSGRGIFDGGHGAKPRIKFDQAYTSAHYANSDQDEKRAN